MANRGEHRWGNPTVVSMSILLALFIFRVVAQLWQYWSPTDALPPFSAWHSGLMPYPALVISQLAIVMLSVWVIIGIASGRLSPNKKLGDLLLPIGLVYFAFMGFRLVAGLTFFNNVQFFGAPIPACFHLVLASMVIITARHLQSERNP